MKRILCVVLCLLCTVGLFGGCAKQPKENYPVTFGGATLDKAPARVISLAPNITDVLDAIGYRSVLVGVSEFENDPTLPQVGSAAVPDIDGMIALSPDLVLTTAALSAEDAQRLAIRNIAVATVPYCTTLEQLKTLYTDLAALLGGNVKGRINGESAAKTLQETIDQSKSSQNKSVLYVAADALTVATGDTLIGELLTELGCTNAANASKNWTLTDTKGISADLIFCTAVEREAVKVQYAHTAAVKNGKVFEIDAALLERQGKSLLAGIKTIGKQLPKEEKK